MAAAAAAAAAVAPSSFPLSLSVDSSLRSSPLSSAPSVSFHRSHSHPVSISSFRPASSVIAASSSSSSPGGIFLDAVGLHRLQTLDKYRRECGLKCGWLEIRPMEDGEVESTVQLLSESFAESMGMPPRYVPLLAFFVRQYLVDRRFLFPHAAMLLGFYREGGGEPVLACTAEVSFDARGANAAPPTPPPPNDCPYICNMAVKKELRRRGIGSELLKACEELVFRMKAARKVYLHCRVADTAPLKMYKKANYKIVKTDSVLVWLTLQRRKHLLVKELLVNNDSPLNSGAGAAAVGDDHVAGIWPPGDSFTSP